MIKKLKVQFLKLWNGYPTGHIVGLEETLAKGLVAQQIAVLVPGCIPDDAGEVSPPPIAAPVVKEMTLAEEPTPAQRATLRTVRRNAKE